MSRSPDHAEQREVESLARRYARQGYRVVRPHPGAQPAFLGDYVPDLIAESEQDRVIVEVKRSDAVKGSNDLLQAAEKVAAEVGWRFELVTVAPANDRQARTSRALVGLRKQAERYLGLGLVEPALICAWHALNEALTLAALPYVRAAWEKSAHRLARDLVTKGVVAPELLGSIRAAEHRFMAVVAGRPAEPVTERDVTDTLFLVDQLLGTVSAAAE